MPFSTTGMWKPSPSKTIAPLAQDLELDNAVDAGDQFTVGIGDANFAQQVRVAGSKASAIRVTLPGQVRSAISGTRTTASTPGLTRASC